MLSTELFGAHAGHVVPAALRRHHRPRAQGHRRAGAADRARLGDPRRLLTALHPLGCGHLDARADDDLRQRGTQRRAGGGACTPAGAATGRRGTATAASCSRGPCPTGIDRDFFDAIMSECKIGYGVEQKVDFYRRADARDGLRLQVVAPETRRRVLDDPFQQVVACMRKVLDSWDSRPGAALPPVHRRGRGVGHGRRRAAHGASATSAASRAQASPSPQPSGTSQPPGPPLRRLRGAQPGRGPGGRPRLPVAHLRGTTARQPHLPRASTRWRRTSPTSTSSSWAVARDLVGEREYDPQEIEFTFESASRRRTSTCCRSGPWCRSRRRSPLVRHQRRPVWAPGSRGHGRRRRRLLRTGGHQHGSDRPVFSTRRRTRTSFCSARIRCPRTWT